MPRESHYCCETCFFSFSPGLPGYEYVECQFEAHKSLPDNGEDNFLPRVHAKNCVCPFWRHHQTFKSLSEIINPNYNSFVLTNAPGAG